MRPLSDREQEIYNEMALKWLSKVVLDPNMPGNEHKPIYNALARAIITIRLRDDEIAQLKGQK